MPLAAQVLKGDTRAMGRLISLVENDPAAAIPHLQALYAHTGGARVIGITGPPGAGKSTITHGLARLLRDQGLSVGIVAVDPTSPFSGGALLGDRVRMQSLATDRGVFIRSMGARGHLGGLARAVHNVVRVLDASGKDVVFVETVGVGQSEVDIVRTADTVLVSLAPGWGDEIQTLKAGILEIADLLVINKADHPDAHRLARELEMLLYETEDQEGWLPLICRTVATTGEGMSRLLEGINQHWSYLQDSGALARRRAQRYEAELLAIVEDYWRDRFRCYWEQQGGWEVLLGQVVRQEKDPFSAAHELLIPFLHPEEGG